MLLLLLSSLITGLFFPVLLLNQWWSPPLRLQASHCSTLRITCHVPSIAVFCSESIECFLVWIPNFSLNPLLIFQWLQLLLVQSYISGSTSVVSLYINSFILASFFPFFLHYISVRRYCHVCQYASFLLFVFNYHIWPICRQFSVCVYPLMP